jgi:hypothetical protein
MHTDLIFALGIALGLVLGWVSLWCYLKPDLGRLIGRLIGALAIGAGVWCVAMPLVALARGEHNKEYRFGSLHGGVDLSLGAGLGLLVVGLMILRFARTGKAGTMHLQAQASDFPDKQPERADGMDAKRPIKT